RSAGRYTTVRTALANRCDDTRRTWPTAFYPWSSSPCPCVPWLSVGDSELEVQRERIGPTAEIDLRSCAGDLGCKALTAREVAYSVLVPQLAADPDRPNRNSNAAEDHRPCRRAAPGEVPVDDRHVV